MAVTSAGTHALVGEPVEATMAELLQQVGVDPAGFRSRQLDESDLRRADLVLTMTRAQRMHAVDLAPAVVRRTFTLRELARLVRAVDPGELPWSEVGAAERLRAAIPLAAARRRRSEPGQDDVPDPYRRPPEVHRRAFREIMDAVEEVVRVARPTSRAQPFG